MADVFDGRGKGPGNQGSPTAPPSLSKGGGANHSIEFDNETGEMSIVLPPHLAHLKTALSQAVYEEFFLSNPDAIGDISEFISTWLKENAEP
ncbi:MAG: hypothetical protein CMH54_08975 [Myxococcales bacterium]|nr:hypothetical protein [Myxococcales bacterium]|tara:strand:+ start:1007 stop:1282 length:276 start_codon:yes stop_codon:yes gene_type:complete